MFFLAYPLIWGWGVGYYILEHDSDTTQGNQGGRFLVSYSLIYPFATLLSVLIYKLYDSRGKMTLFTGILTGIVFIKGLISLGLAYWLVSW